MRSVVSGTLMRLPPTQARNFAFFTIPRSRTTRMPFTIRFRNSRGFGSDVRMTGVTGGSAISIDGGGGDPLEAGDVADSVGTRSARPALRNAVATSSTRGPAGVG